MESHVLIFRGNGGRKTKENRKLCELIGQCLDAKFDSDLENFCPDNALSLRGETNSFYDILALEALISNRDSRDIGHQQCDLGCKIYDFNIFVHQTLIRLDCELIIRIEAL